MNDSTSSETLQVLLIERQSDVIADIHSLLTEIKECQLKVYSSVEKLPSLVTAEQPDLVLVEHHESVADMVTKIHKIFPHLYIIVLLPTVDDDVINEYIKAGANGLLFKDRNFQIDLISAVKKALIRIVERKSFLVNSLSSSSFFSGSQDNELLLQNVKALHEGQTVLHYKIFNVLGEGGMGEVYRAEDLKLGRQVALKVLPPRVTRNENARKRLAREARAASALNHPNIVTIHAIEETGDLSFIAMEFVEGDSLYRLLQEGPVPFARLLDIAVQVADALSAAHTAGLIHRDIKPANIMISNRGQVKLLDFGLAKWVQTGDQEMPDNLTGVGVPIGTVTYMSPEQTQALVLDARTDIFSFGSVLYQAATGKLAFHGPSVLAMMHEIATAEPQPPSALNSTIPAAFDQIILKALAKERDQRYVNAAEMMEDLRKLKLSVDTGEMLPAGRSTSVKVVRQTSTGTLRTPSDSGSEPAVYSGKVLLVEDNEDNRDMLSRRLRRKGFEVVIAVNGQEAIEKATLEKPNLILMDISLPVMDGFEASRRLKASEETKHIPIIALTAHAMAGDREKALSAGCDDYDTKPVELDRLLKKMSSRIPR